MGKQTQNDPKRTKPTSTYCSSDKIFIWNFLAFGTVGTLNGTTAWSSFFMATRAISPGLSVILPTISVFSGPNWIESQTLWFRWSRILLFSKCQTLTAWHVRRRGSASTTRCICWGLDGAVGGSERKRIQQQSYEDLFVWCGIRSKLRETRMHFLNCSRRVIENFENAREKQMNVFPVELLKLR